MTITDRDRELIDQLADIGDSINGHGQQLQAQEAAISQSFARLRGSLDVIGKSIVETRESSRELVDAIDRLRKYGLWIAIAGLTLAAGHLVLGIIELIMG